MNKKRHMLGAMVLSLSILALTGCSDAGSGILTIAGINKVPSHLVKIYDTGARTEMMVREGDSVASLLADAGIELAEQDYISETVESSVVQDLDIEIKRYAKVNVVDDGEVTEVELVGGKVQDALDAAGKQLKDHDYLNVDEDEWLETGDEIIITHRVEVTLTVDGETNTGLTEAKTVKAFLKEKNVKLHKWDRMNYKKGKKLKEGMEIVIQRVQHKKEKETQVIEYTTSRENTSSMSKGKTKVKVSGVNGEKVITYLVIYVDGVEESREIVGEKVTKEPVNEVILVGTYVAPKKDSGGSKPGKHIVSREYQYDCDGSGHGVIIITWSDGSVTYKYF